MMTSGGSPPAMPVRYFSFMPCWEINSPSILMSGQSAWKSAICLSISGTREPSQTLRNFTVPFAAGLAGTPPRMLADAAGALPAAAGALGADAAGEPEAAGELAAAGDAALAGAAAAGL